MGLTDDPNAYLCTQRISVYSLRCCEMSVSLEIERCNGQELDGQ